MKTFKRFLSVFLGLLMLLSMLPSQLVFAKGMLQDSRRVYLHARGENPTGEVNSSSAYQYEVMDLYFAIDNPNMGNYIQKGEESESLRQEINAVRQEKLAEAETVYADKAINYAAKAVNSAQAEIDTLKDTSLSDEDKQKIRDKYADYLNDEEVFDAAAYAEAERKWYIDFMGNADADREEDYLRHDDPQNDLNGYTVKIYYDSNYFDLASGDTDNPIVYQVPNESANDEVTQVKPDAEKQGVTVPDKGAYFYVTTQKDIPVEGSSYRAAYLTVFFTGSYLPQKTTGDDTWYNLCKLPLIPKTLGTTQVYIDSRTADKYTLTLFAKDVTEPGFSPTFQYSAVNNGYHTINIQERPIPKAPEPSKPKGTYINGIDITLRAENNCAIYYSRDGGDPIKYWEPGQETRPDIDISQSTVITTWAVRTLADGSTVRSLNAIYEYEIIPDVPGLFYFDQECNPIRILTERYQSNAFQVYPRPTPQWQEDLGDNQIYYTYSQAAFDPNNFIAGQNADESWVLLSSQAPELLIDQKRTLRMVTRNSMGKFSKIAEFKLGIAPDPVTANPDTNLNCTSPFEVELFTSPGAFIKYTTDGTTPSETNGYIYANPITVTKDTQIQAVSFFDGETPIYCDTISSFSYIFTSYAEDSIDAFYPPATYEETVYVTLTAKKPEYTIRYTTDDTDPTEENGQTFSEPIKVDKNTTIRARIIYPDGTLGTVYPFGYTIKPLPPAFTPISTQFTNAGTVLVSCLESTEENTDRYSLYYTVGKDGKEPSDPTDPNNKERILADPLTDSATVQIDGYTTIRAAVLKDNEEYSYIETHSYDVVIGKPSKPLTTLIPGYYTRENGSAEGFTTGFLPVPSGTTIYYTVSYDGADCPTPVPGDTENGTHQNVPGKTFIDIKGKTVIKAIAVNEFGESEIASFTYTVTPEAPEATPSATVYGALPVVKVDGIAESEITYSITEQEGNKESVTVTLTVPESGTFYLDTATGTPYKTPDCKSEDCLLDQPNQKELDAPVVLEMKAELDKVVSPESLYRYDTSDDPDTLAPPYADKATGTYEEIKQDEDNNLLYVNLDSLNKQPNAIIEYKYGNNDPDWKTYTGTLKLKKYTVLQVRARLDDGNAQTEDPVSTMVSYVYDFIPLPPVIELPSGTYSKYPNAPTTGISLDNDGIAPDIPSGVDYDIYYQMNGEGIERQYQGEQPEILHTLSFRAQVENNETGRRSKNVVHYYVIESETTNGLVGVHKPYQVNRLSADLLNTRDDDPNSYDYADGIRLYPKKTDEAVNIIYSYTYRKVDGTEEITTPNYLYSDKMPILVNDSMDYIKISAYLQYSDGNPVPESHTTHYIDFVHLEAPITNLEQNNPGKIDYPKTTSCTVLNGRAEEKNILLYYTLDGTDPRESESRILYTGTEEDTFQLLQNTTVKAVYYSSCDHNLCEECYRGNITACKQAVYGKVGTYEYVVTTTSSGSGSSGGGGGGGGTTTIDNTRKYTKDIFGTEHPTHIGYINGYPDGSVQPDGHITREETASILYRVKNKEYESPFTVTGKMFPDVTADRWSVAEIEYMTNDGVIYGYPDGEFKPARDLTRAEFAALIRRFAGLEFKESENVFPDLSTEHWAYEDILALYQSGLLEGYEDGTFRAENQITRAEVMTVINKLLGRNPSEPYVKSLHFNPFNDLAEEQWYYVIVLEATITHNYYLDNTGLEIKWEDCK